VKPFQVLSPLRKASRQVQIYMTAQCRPHGVSTVEAHLLGYCLAKGPCPISELQRVLGEHKSTLTAMLDRLESKGLVLRKPNPADRRSWTIEVSSRGRALARKLRRVYETFESQIVSEVDPGDLRGFAAVMARISVATNVSLNDPGSRPK